MLKLGQLLSGPIKLKVVHRLITDVARVREMN